ncbi:hypothetical protein [Halobacteriovorax sp. JY17]|uniref:hypothetical protein n=1 Tax=Halobacteriovorax sp. JY17 TaxID=2014617 RepID=UPI000C636DF6|nr:hypothetical protein [Halobacteriovorax sp. JY17]PIK16154.1 MAG: hypothetical protein CES88_05315 [Halobacteriovorax sp. JY17]
MKTILSLIFILSSIQVASANLDCDRVLTSDYSVDSQSFKLNEFDLESDFEVSAVAFAREAVTKLYSNLGCEELKQKSLQTATCSEVIKGVSTSKVCYLENKQGYFLVSKDMMENINILYNRWD